MSDLEAMLRKALEERKNKPLQAARDLNAVATELSAAIRNVSGDRIQLILDPLKPKEKDGPTFALILRLPDEDVALRVVVLSDETGYPVKLWASYDEWDTQRPLYPNSVHPLSDLANLRENIQLLIAGPQSEVVRIIANQLAVMEAEAGRELEGATA